MMKRIFADFKLILFGVALYTIVAMGCATTSGKDMIDLRNHYVTKWQTESGLVRFDYIDVSHRGENHPIASVYFSASAESVDPFKQVKVGMVKSEFIHILGEPYLDHDDTPYGYMWYRRIQDDVEIKYDHEGRVVSIDGGGFKGTIE